MEPSVVSSNISEALADGLPSFRLIQFDVGGVSDHTHHGTLKLRMESFTFASASRYGAISYAWRCWSEDSAGCQTGASLIDTIVSCRGVCFKRQGRRVTVGVMTLDYIA